MDVIEPALEELKMYVNAAESKLSGIADLQADVTEIRCILKAQVEGSNAARCLSTYR